MSKHSRKYFLVTITLTMQTVNQGETSLNALVFGSSFDFKTLTLKPGIRLLLLVLGWLGDGVLRGDFPCNTILC